MRILVVDDDKIMLEALEFNLKNDGYEVVTADDGKEALEIIQHHSLDLIIIDVMMPGLSGLELLNLLKIYYFKKTPVIITSALDQKDVISTAFGLGADDFLVKPINFEELSLMVKKYTDFAKEKR